MRSSTLHAALSEFAEQAAWQFAAETAEGAELPFELAERGKRSGRTPLYCYRPLTAEFIRGREDSLHRLPAYVAASRALEELDGVERYLRARGERKPPSDPRERAHLAMRSFLDALFEDATEFELTPERFSRAYKELEAAVFAGKTETVVIAPLLGLELESEEVALGDGLTLVWGDRFDEPPPEAVWAGSGERPNVLAVLKVQSHPGARAPLSVARLRFRRLLTAMRLYAGGGLALGPVAWERSDDGPWRMVALGPGGRARGRNVVPTEQEDELRAFANLVARRLPRGGEVAWALARFEMGCERVAPFEALTDHLLALRALLEPEGPASGRLAGRLAAICGLPGERAALAERVAHAISLERAVVAGLAPAEAGAAALVSDLADHLRAVLRDVLFGHLDSDVCSVADGLIDEVAGDAVTVEG
ncbi:MAG: hypothetical protein QOI98_1340 [Solirubrobacteraceae bacterium]|nr:hypothetical protein [Solirubrobacteraceae bacterium]